MDDSTWPPKRVCNGGPNGTAWCGKDATLVCTDKDGMQWFCCIDHDEKCVSITIEEFFAQVKASIEKEYDDLRRLRDKDP